jgi:prophage maintenance system killer protein
MTNNYSIPTVNELRAQICAENFDREANEIISQLHSSPIAVTALYKRKIDRSLAEEVLKRLQIAFIQQGYTVMVEIHSPSNEKVGTITVKY